MKLLQVEINVALIGVIASNETEARRFVEIIDLLGIDSRVWLLTDFSPGQIQMPLQQDSAKNNNTELRLTPNLEKIDGLLVSGDQDSEILRLENLENEFLKQFIVQALERDLPFLGVGGGMHVLNVAMGGSLIEDVADHGFVLEDDQYVSGRHRIWISPGSKLASVLGSGGQVRVNSLHRNGIREAQKSRQLIASAYAIQDSIIEGLESPKHTWVLAIQFHPERQDEVPRQFYKLFRELADRAVDYRYANG